ncbi:hypothetical protein X777_09947 [Ooceraea biroi]|uniref:Uncharacterized protein n=1 Tax=Ooceraea biroi TaxID=2015173 RepID=A0A026W5B5_OOCBI|nr:hypothetical protein X777_09947 [Ooceraea biroi]
MICTTAQRLSAQSCIYECKERGNQIMGTAWLRSLKDSRKSESLLMPIAFPGEEVRPPDLFTSAPSHGMLRQVLRASQMHDFANKQDGIFRRTRIFIVNLLTQQLLVELCYYDSSAKRDGFSHILKIIKS